MKHHLTRTVQGIILFVVLNSLAPAAHGQIGPRGGKASTEAGVSAPTQSTALPASTVQIRIECGNATARVKTIADGLKLVGALHPAVLLVSGTCHENVVIQGLNGITLQGNPKATIDGGSDPNFGAVEISGSINIALNNLTVTGSGQGVGCLGVSYCILTRVTVENSLGDGADVQAGARLEIFDSVVQNNANAGLGVSGVAAFFGGAITGNGANGVALRNGGFFATLPGNLIATVTIRNNAGNGIGTALHNTIILNSAIVSGNAVDGVTLQMGSTLDMFASNITNNRGHQVRIGDLSVARFSGFQSNTVTGANFPDVVCDPQFSATRQLAANAVGATTNCPAELPPTP
jgi:hypothetical protein